MDSTPDAISPSPKVLWPQVWGLAAVQGAIALTWVIYNLYLPGLLTNLGLAASLATGLLILENGIGILMEPLMGSFSDRTQQWVGSRFPFIALGIILASVLFLLIPIVSGLVLALPQDQIHTGLLQSLKWLFVLVLVAWALAMTIFRSPALSLLGRYAFSSQMPQAASILTLVGGLAGALGPLASQVILGMGEFATFTLGAIVLLVAAQVLRSVGPQRQVTEPQPYQQNGFSPSPTAAISWPGLALVFGAGVGIALGFRLLMQSFPQILETQVIGAPTGLILGGIFLSLALTAIPSGWVATYLGNTLAMILGLVVMAGLLGFTLYVTHPLGAALIAVGLGASFSLVSNGTIPFALTMVSQSRAGLGTGIFFSGGALASSLFGSLVSQPEAMAASTGAIAGAAAFLAAGICIAFSGPFQLPKASA
ncbi:MAG: SLC45 family MFS transporter [Synechococcaceae cyanobacterium SM2_3_1]|nr:SLC45 family MFS transporter [Synechococcaceae cyanobacterium SM2_3_1]